MKRTGVRSIGEVIGDCIRESHMEAGLLEARVCAAWDALVVGRVVLCDQTSRRTFRDGVLTCRLRSSVVRSYLQPQAELLRSRLNAALQGEYVKQVKLL